MKRFWKTISVEQGEDGWMVRLDQRPVRTPAKRPVVVPQKNIAEGIAAEWDAQTDEIDPLTMPLMRAASTCLDRAVPEIDAVRANLVSFGGTDLLCYRATHPDELIQRQAEAWDPMLDWAEQTYGARLATTAGVMHVIQPDAALTLLAAEVEAHDAWMLTGLSELVTISGSLVLGLAVSRAALPAEEAWRLSRIDDEWNAEQWGHDDDAAALAARRRRDFLNAADLLRLLGRG